MVNDVFVKDIEKTIKESGIEFDGGFAVLFEVENRTGKLILTTEDAVKPSDILVALAMAVSGVIEKLATDISKKEVTEAFKQILDRFMTNEIACTTTEE